MEAGWPGGMPGHSCRQLWHAAIRIDLPRLPHESVPD